MNNKHQTSFCGRSRRTFLNELGLGFGGIALNAMLSADGVAKTSDGRLAKPEGRSHFAPRAKNVIWIFLSGGREPDGDVRSEAASERTQWEDV